MTTRAQPNAETNGAPAPAEPTPPAAPTLEDRVAALEQTVMKFAAALSQLLAQQVQPQVQAGIFAQLTGAAPQQPPPT